MLHRKDRYVTEPRDFSGVRRRSRESQIPLKSKGLRCSIGAGADPADWHHERAHVAAEETIVSGMAGRYARALFELALDGKSVDAVKSDLDLFEALTAESADLNRLVRSPVFGAEERTRALGAVLAKAGIGGLTPITLRYIAGADYDTISRQLGLTNGSLRGLLNRGMAKLRQMMTDDDQSSETQP
jgi:DNA-directed RNA polymerase specialized sigma24 family protein